MTHEGETARERLNADVQRRIDSWRSAHRIMRAREERYHAGEWQLALRRATTRDAALRALMQGAFDWTHQDYTERTGFCALTVSPHTLFDHWLNGKLTDEETKRLFPWWDDEMKLLTDRVDPARVHAAVRRAAPDTMPRWLRPIDVIGKDLGANSWACMALFDPSQSEHLAEAFVHRSNRAALVEATHHAERNGWSVAPVCEQHVALTHALILDDRAALRAAVDTLEQARALDDRPVVDRIESLESAALACACFGQAEVAIELFESIFRAPRRALYAGQPFTEPPHPRTTRTVLAMLDLRAQRALAARVFEMLSSREASAAEWLALAQWAFEPIASKSVERARAIIERRDVPFDVNLVPRRVYEALRDSLRERFEQWVISADATEFDATLDHESARVFRFFWFLPDDRALERAVELCPRDNGIERDLATRAERGARQWLSWYRLHASPEDVARNAGLLDSVEVARRGASLGASLRWLEPLVSRETFSRWLAATSDEARVEARREALHRRRSDQDRPVEERFAIACCSAGAHDAAVPSADLFSPEEQRALAHRLSPELPEVVHAYWSGDNDRLLAAIRSTHARLNPYGIGFTVLELFSRLATSNEAVVLGDALADLIEWDWSDRVETLASFDADGILRFANRQ